MYNAVYQDKRYMPGIILSTQTFGNLLVWHPHIHALVSDGVFDEECNFHPVPVIDKNKAKIIFREKIFAELKANNRISDRLVKSMRNWSHSGFSVDNSVKIEEDNFDEKILKHLNLWPVEYPVIKEGDRASPINLPFNLDLLSKRLNSKHIN